MSEVAAIILAAGVSRRMGAQNKLLLPIAGIPMVRHMVSIYQAVATCPVLVVTGHDAEAVKSALRGSGAETVFNPSYSEGQPTSVACGLRAAGAAPLLLIGLGDQPLLNSDDLRALLQAHQQGDPSRISIPKEGDRRGNPIVVPDVLRPRLLNDPRSPGCKMFTRAHPEHVHFLALSSLGFYSDIDTPEAYSALMQSAAEPSL